MNETAQKIRNIVNNSSGESKEVLQGLVTTCSNSIKELNIIKQKLDYVVHENKLLKNQLFGSSSEKCKVNDIPYQADMDLFDEAEVCADEVEIEPELADSAEQKTEPRKASGRKPLPKSLPREIIEHDLSVEDKQCSCGSTMTCIGFQSSEKLSYQPPKLKVIEHQCKKYACTDCSKANKQDHQKPAQLKMAKKPNQIIPKGIATPSLLSHIVVSKYCDYLPLYRQESQFKRWGIDLSRQTISQWILKVGELVTPLINLLQDSIIDYDVAYADETTLQVLKEPDKKAQSKSYMWCFIGGPPDKRSIVYQYHASRRSSIPDQFFEGYRGSLHVDAYSGYKKLLKSTDIVGVNCMAHARRKFIEALPNGKEKGISGQMVRYIRELYGIEKELKAKDASAQTILKVRQQKSKPILDTIKLYLNDKIKGVPPQSAIGKAINYMLNIWGYLITYIADGRYEIDNNRAERAIKPFVMGRKNWLFSASVAGANASANMYTLIESAKANGHEPIKYLEHIFNVIPICKTADDYDALLPWNVVKDNSQVSSDI